MANFGISCRPIKQTEILVHKCTFIPPNTSIFLEGLLHALTPSRDSQSLNPGRRQANSEVVTWLVSHPWLVESVVSHLSPYYSYSQCPWLELVCNWFVWALSFKILCRLTMYSLLEFSLYNLRSIITIYLFRKLLEFRCVWYVPEFAYCLTVQCRGWSTGKIISQTKSIISLYNSNRTIA